MMGHKHLHELLSEDQEPFQLKTYIADRRCQFRRKTTTTLSHIKKGKPISHHVCFFSFEDSPDVRKSPFPDLPSPAKSPAGNTVFLHIPARTATLLLDAAVRIQKQSCKKPETKNVGLGLLGSFLKRLKSNRNKQREITVMENTSSGEEYKQRTNKNDLDDKSAYEMGLVCNNSRLSSAGWSETNEEKSLDLETSCSSRSHDSEQFVALETENGGFSSSCENCFCHSSPFRFSLQKTPSPGHSTPEFLSPATSPTHHYNQEKASYETESLEEVRVSEEEEKEQFSPVSILDPPFEDEDGEGHESGDEEEDGYDLECSYASVQRAKQQLLQKLRRFERLAELDPIELEKRMLEREDNEDLAEEEEEEEECDNYDLVLEHTNEEFVREVFSHLGFVHQTEKMPWHMKRLVSDIIAEEIDQKNGEENVVVMKRVCRRLDSWKVVDSNTIDMMVELDLRIESEGWKRHDQEQVRETGKDIEVAIFGFLIEELSQELISSAGGH